jgi:hypothetical protein
LPLIFRKTLIQMAKPLGEAADVRYPLLRDLRREDRARPSPPRLARLLADVDPMIGQQILNVAVTEGRQLLLARKAGPRQTNDWVHNK